MPARPKRGGRARKARRTGGTPQRLRRSRPVPPAGGLPSRSGRRGATTTKSPRSAAGRTRLEPAPVRRRRAARILTELKRLYPDAACELHHSNALELLVATILSAQCTDERVNRTTPALFARYRSAADYANAEPAELEGLIRPTGFYRNKAKSLMALGRALQENFEQKVPETMDQLVTLPGVGRKTANVLIAEWFGRPGIAVDTHVIRLTGPVWRLTEETDPVKIEFELYDLVPETDRSFFGVATIWHGRRVCSARNPDCAACTLRSFCPSAAADLSR
jgi:endonuclease-3